MSYTINQAIEELKSLSEDTPTKPKLPNDELLDEYEQKLGIKLPSDYRLFLKEASDVFVGYINPLLVSENEDSGNELSVAINEARELGVPSEWLPVCEDNGDYYCIDQSGAVQFWSQDGFTDENWCSLADWIKEVWIEEA